MPHPQDPRDFPICTSYGIVCTTEEVPFMQCPDLGRHLAGMPVKARVGEKWELWEQDKRADLQ